MNRTLAALAMTALIAGCADKPAETGSGEKVAEPSEAAQFAACMRDNGVSEFPDPDASGRLTIDGVLNGSSLDPDSSVWKQALAACRDLQPPGFTGAGERSAEQQDGALAFAECIREHGVEDFPDPVDGEPLVNTNRIPSSASSSGMATLNAAMKACRDFVRDQVDGR